MSYCSLFDARQLAAGALVLTLHLPLLGQEMESFGLPQVGEAQLRLLSPTLLELSLVTTKQAPPARVTTWDYVTTGQQLRVPAASQFNVTIDGLPAGVQAVGFRRRPLYAPMKRRDLRIGNYLYLQLAGQVAEG